MNRNGDKYSLSHDNPNGNTKKLGFGLVFNQNLDFGFRFFYKTDPHFCIFSQNKTENYTKQVLSFGKVGVWSPILFENLARCDAT
mmetsp:Transcript_12065/g.18010  ORF Transcript_12065/g.18010 Transcript_12065/m.18010 type:complete len:85 (-) Transcript_12065:47-301(-)